MKTVFTGPVKCVNCAEGSEQRGSKQVNYEGRHIEAL